MMTEPMRVNREVVRELAELTLKLCTIPSETGDEKQIADWVETRCRNAAPEHNIHRIGNSIICDPAAASAHGGSTVPTVGLIGHLDTVRCAQEQLYEIRDNRVYGCGASDMKAGIATMLMLLRQWEELSGARPVFVFYDKEEGAHEENGLQPVLESALLAPLDFAFVLEPTDGALQLGCMGTLHATVTVMGQRAHSARPWQGQNAIYRSLPLLQRLQAFERREVQFGELTFYEVMSVTQAHTHNSKNVVPDALVLNVNYRFAPGKSTDTAEVELRHVVGGEGDVEVFDRAPAGEVYLDHPLIEPWRLREGIERQPKQAWTDVARLTQHGIPAVNFGPGETAQAHQANEWCSIASLESTYRALQRFFDVKSPAG
jgi:succinyl-diaminopimelate desuccinylase